MSKKVISNIIGTIAIMSGILAFTISILSLIFHIYGTSLIVLFLMIVYIAFRDMYRDFKKMELDEELKKHEGES